MPSLTINDIQMHYEHRVPESGGSGAYPLLMLSGMASDSASWQPVAAELARHFELLIPDNRCTGRTLPNPVETSREHMVRDLLALLDALGMERVNVLGHSMGGMVGWSLAEIAPGRVNHLISAGALSQTIHARTSLFRTLSALRTDENEAQWFEMLYHFIFSPSFFKHSTAVSLAISASMAYPHKQGRESFAIQAAALSTFLSPVDLSAVTCQVSLVTGANDILTTPAAMQAFGDKYNYPYAIIPDAAHALHWEQTQAVVKFVLDELADTQES